MTVDLATLRDLEVMLGEVVLSGGAKTIAPMSLVLKIVTEAADTIEALRAERDEAKSWAERLRSMMTKGGNQLLDSEQAWKRRATAAEARCGALEEALGDIRDYCQKLRNGTDDWFDLVEIQAMTTLKETPHAREG